MDWYLFRRRSFFTCWLKIKLKTQHRYNSFWPLFRSALTLKFNISLSFDLNPHPVYCRILQILKTLICMKLFFAVGLQVTCKICCNQGLHRMTQILFKIQPILLRKDSALFYPFGTWLDTNFRGNFVILIELHRKGKCSSTRVQPENCFVKRLCAHWLSQSEIQQWQI